MGVPKYKPSHSRRRMRRGQDSLTAPGLVKCSNCGLGMKPHTVCASCGHYRAGKTGKTRVVVHPGGQS